MREIIEGAMQLGVIPMVALFLVFKMQAQNKRLTDMIEAQAKIQQAWLDEVFKSKIAPPKGTQGKREVGA